jgi:hypothetical protein
MTNELSTVTRDQMEQAFEAWENGFRINPAAYRTEDETRQLPVSAVSAERADYFFELLKLEQAKA